MKVATDLNMAKSLLTEVLIESDMVKILLMVVATVLEEVKKAFVDSEAEMTSIKKTLAEVKADCEDTESRLIRFKRDNDKLTNSNSKYQQMIKEQSRTISSLKRKVEELETERESPSVPSVELIQEEITRYISESSLLESYGTGYFKGFTSCRKWLIKGGISTPAGFFDNFDEDQVADMPDPNAMTTNNPIDEGDLAAIEELAPGDTQS